MNINTPFKLYWEHEGTVYEAYSYDDTNYGIKSSRGNLHLYRKTSIHDLINKGEVVLVKDPQMVTIPESEYHSLIEEVNMLQELVAELSAPQTVDNIFKPISDYTLEDWQQAEYEDWEFQCRDGHTVKINAVYESLNYPIEGNDSFCRDIKGFWITDDTDPDDIIKRIQ